MTTSAPLAPPTSGPQEPERLSGNMNTFKLVLSVLAFSSPLVSMAGYLALTIGTTGTTSPVAFLLTSVALLIFTVGYMAMTKRMRRPGAFYAYITEGLGKAMGLGSAYLATISYIIINVGVYAFAGEVILGVVQKFGGPEIPWWVGGMAVLLLVATLGYFNVDVSARVLVWVMVIEVVVVMIFNIAVFAQGGAEGVNVGVFNVVEFAQVGPGAFVGVLFAILVFIGFEATVLYRDEVKDPDRTVPRATYISVIFIGALYVISNWALITAFGSDAQEVAQDPAAMFTDGMMLFIGGWFADVAALLVVTAAIASILSIHNASTRYTFNLANDGALPRFLGKVHPKFRSPYRASLSGSIIGFAAVLFFAIGGDNLGVTYGQLAGVGSTGIILLMVFVSISVIVYFRRIERDATENAWKTIVAPVISGVFLAMVLVFAAMNYYLVVGGEIGQYDWLLSWVIAPIIIGLIVAPIIKAKRPDNYVKIGGTDRDEDTTK